jgi:hypothetical protein
MLSVVSAVSVTDHTSVCSIKDTLRFLLFFISIHFHLIFLELMPRRRDNFLQTFLYIYKGKLSHEQVIAVAHWCFVNRDYRVVNGQ